MLKVSVWLLRSSCVTPHTTHLLLNCISLLLLALLDTLELLPLKPETCHLLSNQRHALLILVLTILHDLVEALETRLRVSEVALDLREPLLVLRTRTLGLGNVSLDGVESFLLALVLLEISGCDGERL